MSPAIHALIAPRSIAILGASNDLQKLNGRTLKFLVEKGYAGNIYPVNPKYESISHPGGELRCYPTVLDIPGPVDLAIVTVPARFVIDQVRALGRKGVPAAIIYSSGFGEMGDAGHALEDELVAAAREGKVRLCGPNCLGLINAFDRVIATFSQFGSGEPLASAGSYAFLPHRGGFTRDASDRAHTSDRSDALVGRVRANTRDLLRALAEDRAIAPDAASASRAAKLLLMYFREVHRCDPPAIRVVLESRVLAAT